MGEEARVSPPEGTSQTCLLFTLDTARGQLVQGEALSACLGLGLTTWWRGAGYPSPEGTRGQGLPERARRGRLLQRALANRGALGAPPPTQVSPTFHLHREDCPLVHPEQAGPGWSLAPGAEIPALAQLPGAETAGGVSCCCPPPGRALSPGLGPAPAPPPPRLGSHPPGWGRRVSLQLGTFLTCSSGERTQLLAGKQWSPAPHSPSPSTCCPRSWNFQTLQPVQLIFTPRQLPQTLARHLRCWLPGCVSHTFVGPTGPKPSPNRSCLF